MIARSLGFVLGGERLDVLAPLTIVGAVSWLLLMLGSWSIVVPVICSAELIWSLPSSAELTSVFVQLSPWAMAAGWAAMIGAMMLPTTIVPLLHIQQRSLRGVRFGTVLGYSAGYLASWSLVAPVLLGAALFARLSFSDQLVWASALALAALWQVSPWKQTAMNRCHAMPRISGFAPRAYRDAVSWGARHGFWCVASCWALMLVALMAPAHHALAMASIAAWIWAERLEHPRRADWRLRLPVVASRLVATHTAGALGLSRKTNRHAAGPQWIGKASGDDHG